MATYTTPVYDLGGRLFVPVPFDPDAEWTPKPKHHIHGTVGGCRVRAVITAHEGQRGFIMGSVWARDFDASAPVQVEIMPEGPQRSDLDPDIAAALAANPDAGAFFDSLAQFYRKAYLKWIDGTKGRPDVRAARIAELVTLLEAGVKQRPR